MSKFERIGWIGLGKMGDPMALNLIKAGNNVTVYNRSAGKAKPHTDAGGALGASPAEVAQNSDIVFTMISDDNALEQIALGDDGVIANLAEGSTYVDMSTVSPVASEKVAEAAAAKNIAYLRSPVNGTVMQAEASTLVIMISGPKERYDAVLPLYQLMGDKIFYIGETEQARYLKLCINTMIGISSSMMGEALTFGEAGGLDWDTMIDIIAASAVGSPVVNYKVDMLKKRDFTAAFTAVQMAKDFDLALGTAEKYNVPMPITSMVRSHWDDMMTAGRGEDDFFAYVEVLEEKAGIKK
ncbi:MAG: NAD(P)-dependent oxidoreductase [Rhodospirillaceae bacterium]